MLESWTNCYIYMQDRIDSRIDIFVDRLKDGQSDNFTAQLNPSALELPNNSEISFKDPVRVSGSVSLIDGFLCFYFDNIHTSYQMPCSICNAMTAKTIVIEDESYPLEEGCKESCIDAAPFVRELLLLNVPYTIECSEQGCPERQALSSYLKPLE